MPTPEQQEEFLNMVKKKEELSVKNYNALREDYDKLAKTYDSLVKEHNTLVDIHNKVINKNTLVEDNKALIQFVVALSRGLAFYAEGSYVFRDGNNMSRLVLQGEARLDPGRMFCADMHNEILDVLVASQKTNRFAPVYRDWLERCQKLTEGENQSGGIKQ